MKVIKLKDLSKQDYSRIINRSAGSNKTIMPVVRKIMNDVKNIGDKVIIKKYQLSYGKVKDYQNYSGTQEAKSKMLIKR